MKRLVYKTTDPKVLLPLEGLDWIRVEAPTAYLKAMLQL